MKKILFILLCVSMAVLARAGNVVTLPTVTSSPGDEVTLAVALDNDDAVSALQVLVPVSDGFTVIAGSETVTSRGNGHSARVGMKDGMLNIMVWSNSLTALQGSSGEVVTFRVALGNEPATIPLVASRVTLTDPDGNPLEATAADGSVTVAAPKAQLATRELDYGHIPIRDTYHQSLVVTNVGTAPLTVTGIDPSAPEFSSETAFPMVIEAGATSYVDITYSPVERGAIEETVRLLSDNIAGNNTIRLTADPFAVNELHVLNASGIADSTVTIHLTMNNMDAISGLQVEFNLSEQLQYVDGTFALSGRKADHQLTVTCRGQHLTALAWSLGNQTFSGEDGEIATFDVRLSGRYGTELRASKARLVATYKGEDMDVLSDHYGGWVEIASPQLNCAEQLDMGATPVTEDAQATVNVYNGGGAPLRIDRIVFDTLGFTVTEQVPLIIEPWQSVDLHVTFTGQEQAPFATWMQLYSNDPDHPLHNIRVTGSRFAPNYLAFTADDVINGSDLVVNVDMSNYDRVEGLQFDIHYPHQWFTPTGKYIVVNRATGFSVAQRSVGQGVLRCFVYSLSDGTMEPGEGRILSLPFTVSEGVPYGDYSLTIDNIKAGTSALTDKYAGAEEHCNFQVLIITYATSLTLDKESATMLLGEEMDLTVSIQPENVTNPTVVWESSDTTVVVIRAKDAPQAMGGTWQTLTNDFDQSLPFCRVRVNPQNPIDQWCEYLFSRQPNGVQDGEFSVNTSTPRVIDNGNLYWSEVFTDVGDGWFEYEFSETLYFLEPQENVGEGYVKVFIEQASEPTGDQQAEGATITAIARGYGQATITARTVDGSDLSASCVVRVGLPGDVNLDGKVDVTDVNIVVNIILGKDQAANYDGRADVNNSDGVDVSDVNILVNIILGKE